MKKRLLLIVCLLSVAMISCGKEAQDGMTDCGCSTGCTCCNCEKDVIVIEDAEKVLGIESSDVITSQSEVEIEQESETVTEATSQIAPNLSDPITESQVVTANASELTEGEKEARRQLMQQLAEQREALYALPNSIEKTNQIAQIDAMILENNVYDFSSTLINFLGDSITEGVCGDIAEDGSRISYVNYVQEYLGLEDILNRGMAGRMFSDYGNMEYSLAMNLESLLYVTSDATVIFLGANDYLCEQQNKRYGEQNIDSYSTAGYCGALRQTLKYLKNYFGEQDIFFVLVYNVDREVNSTYTDVTLAPQLQDYLAIQKSYAEHYGFHVIDLYSTGFMDLADAATEAAYTGDGLHPNNSGNIILAQHIAAELALYYSNK